MRIISFTEKWPKLQQDRFTTFRYPYWKKGWPVQLFYRSRSPHREKLGEGVIVKLERVVMEPGAYPEIYRLIYEGEAREDGFGSLALMVIWLKKTYGKKYSPIIDKLTIKVTARAGYKQAVLPL